MLAQLPPPMMDTDAATIEPMLETLIAEHGIEKVNANLATLMHGRRFQDWQRVHNIAQNVANRLARSSKKKTKTK